jgi:metal-sulfur cluster biosynthetic enzyme
VATATEAREALSEVLDPEYPISIVDLGLVRGVSVHGATARVQITYTSLGCPCTELIQEDIRDRLLQMDGVGEVEIEEVFEPWTRRDISARGLRIFQESGIG